MGKEGCCCCLLTIETLPDIEITGMEVDVNWISVGDCCFKRRYSYLTAQPRLVTSVDVQRSTWLRTATQIFIAKEYPVFGCGYLFNCAEINTVDDVQWVERLGLIYQRQYIEVYIQLKKITCPTVGEVEKYIISTKHAIGYLDSFITVQYANSSGTFTSLATCCNGIAANNYSNINNEPDWTNPTIWPGYLETLTNGEYWNHKIFDAMPNNISELINGCLAPCTSNIFCTEECVGICLTSEPSEVVPFYDGHLICPTPSYISRTCTYTYNNLFDGTMGCTSTIDYYSVSVITLCPRGASYSSYNQALYCSALTARAIGFTTTAFTLSTSCVFTFGAEVCLQTPTTLIFPP